MNEKNIINFNPKKQLHGYQERYDRDGGIYYRGTHKHKQVWYYNEWHLYIRNSTNFYIR